MTLSKDNDSASSGAADAIVNDPPVSNPCHGQINPGTAIGLASCPMSKLSKCNHVSLSKVTKSYDSIFFGFILNLIKACALGFAYIILMVLDILVPLGARLWKSIFLTNDLEIDNSFQAYHQSKSKWNQVKSISLLGIGIALGSGFREMDSILFHRDSAHNLIQNHNGLASLAAHKLAHSNKIFQQFGDLIIQSQLNSDCSASSFSLSGQLGNVPFQSLSSVWHKLDFGPFGIDAKSFPNADSTASLFEHGLEVDSTPHSLENYSSDCLVQSLTYFDLLLTQQFKFDPVGCYNLLIEFIFDHGKENNLIHNHESLAFLAVHKLALSSRDLYFGDCWLIVRAGAFLSLLPWLPHLEQHKPHLALKLHLDNSAESQHAIESEFYLLSLPKYIAVPNLSSWPLPSEGESSATNCWLIIWMKFSTSCLNICNRYCYTCSVRINCSC